VAREGPEALRWRLMDHVPLWRGGAERPGPALGSGRGHERRGRPRRPSVALRTAVRAGLAPLCAGVLTISPATARAQYAPHILTRSWDTGPDGRLHADRGASGVWFRLKKLGTTASVLYTTAHPDDEQAGVLTLLSRGVGARTSLLTLNRGEGGANAIGAELFDALGLVRSEELRLAGRYYGLDDQYFTTAVDYGFSKTLREAMTSWDREAVLADMVRIIRTNRPLIVVSRFQGSPRDGHGHHQAAGVLTPEAVAAAADPTRFPEQLSAEGLRPWRVRRLYRPVRETDRPWHIQLEPGTYDPVLGSSYESFGNYGLSLQRSQTSGRTRSASGAPARLERIAPATEEREQGPFHGLDTTLTGIFELTGESGSPAALGALQEAEEHIGRARAEFRLSDPSTVVPHLARTLDALSDALGATHADSDAAFLLHIERRETETALVAAMGLEVEATATRRGDPDGEPLGAVVPGDALDVHVRISSAYPAQVRDVRVESRLDYPDSRFRFLDWAIGPYETVVRVAPLDIPADAVPTRPWFHRDSIAANHYEVRDSSDLHLGESRPVAWVATPISVEGRLVRLETPVRVIEPTPPFGSRRPLLTVVPIVSVRPEHRTLILPPERRSVTVSVEVTSNGSVEHGTLSLEAPAEWTVGPEEHAFSFERRGRRATFDFEVTAPRPVSSATSGGAVVPSPVTLQASATVGGRAYAEGYEMIEHPELAPRRLYRDAVVDVVPVDVRTAGVSEVGYVMGVGDDVPAAIAQLGADVALLDADDLASGELSVYQTIVVGTRAYAVRPDLVANNRRLLDFAQAGGHLVVLYQTPEYDPAQQAPFPASLPGNAEEVSEEGAPVAILVPDHALLTTPNRITGSDFDGWVEQRGSKFFAAWDVAYTPLIETHDTGQAPQRGVWLSAEVGDGRFTYAALALHRQLPYGVPGAYRILANLISPGR
jgi:LmbE family N-acetylglucosaminyl deacetylase